MPSTTVEIPHPLTPPYQQKRDEHGAEPKALAPPLRRVPAGPGAEPTSGALPDPGAARSSSDGPHDHTAAVLARRVAYQLVEVLTGRRPAHRIRERLSGPVAGLLATAGRGKRALGPSARLLSVHACLTSSSRVEASAVVGDTESVRALTLRLERKSTEWLCTLLAVV